MKTGCKSFWKVGKFVTMLDEVGLFPTPTIVPHYHHPLGHKWAIGAIWLGLTDKDKDKDKDQDNSNSLSPVGRNWAIWFELILLSSNFSHLDGNGSCNWCKLTANETNKMGYVF